MRHFLFAPFLRWLSRLSHPKLFLVFAGLFLLDMVTPDPIPFVDEILLALATTIFAKWKRRNVPGPSNATSPVEGTATRR